MFKRLRMSITLFRRPWVPHERLTLWGLEHTLLDPLIGAIPSPGGWSKRQPRYWLFRCCWRCPALELNRSRQVVCHSKSINLYCSKSHLIILRTLYWWPSSETSWFEVTLPENLNAPLQREVMKLIAHSLIEEWNIVTLEPATTSLFYFNRMKKRRN